MVESREPNQRQREALGRANGRRAKQGSGRTSRRRWRPTPKELYGRLSTEERAAAKRLFVSLVTPGEGGADARARIATPDDVVMRNVIQRFAGPEPRIIVKDEADGRSYVEISHEALIRQRGRLRGWIDDNRWNLRTRNFLLANRTECLKHDRDPSLLELPALRLEEARQLRGDPGDVVIDEVKDYIDAALERQEQRRKEESARQRAELEGAQRLAEAERWAKEAAEGAARAAAARAAAETQLRTAAEQKALAEQHARDEAEKAAAEQKAHTEAEHAARLQAQASAGKLRRALIGVAAAAVAALIASGVSLYYFRQASLQSELARSERIRAMEQSDLALAEGIRAREESNRAKQFSYESQRALDRANQALAAAINNDLVFNPDESWGPRARDALWRLTLADEAVKNDYMSILTTSPRVACCRFRGHRDRVFQEAGGAGCRGEGSVESSRSRRSAWWVSEGVSVAQASRDIYVHENVLRKWVKEFGADPKQVFPGHGEMKPEQLEIDRLRREVAKLKAERDILKKAAAYFAREST